MTRAVPEWIGKTDDERAPPRVRLRIFERANGRCQECGRRCGPGGESFTFDHTVALVNGGENREANLRLLCLDCHLPKTRADVAEKSRTRRAQMKHAGIKKPRTITGWRRFNDEPVRASRER